MVHEIIQIRKRSYVQSLGELIKKQTKKRNKRKQIVKGLVDSLDGLCMAFVYILLFKQNTCH